MLICLSLDNNNKFVIYRKRVICKIERIACRSGVCHTSFDA